MKNYYKKSVMITTGLLLIICLGFIAKLFIIGELVAGEQVYCTASVNGGKLKLQAETTESAAALWGWKYNYDGKTLYISARKVPVSPLFNEGRYETSINIEMIDNIILGGKKVWSRDN